MKTHLGKIIIGLSCLAILCFGLWALRPSTGSAGERLDIMPYPQQVVLGKGVLNIDENFSLNLTGVKTKRLKSAVGLFINRIEAQTGLHVLNPRAANTQNADFIISVSKSNASIQGVDVDESYTLNIEQNKIHLIAQTEYGALHGLETLLQLIQTSSSGGEFYVPHVKITDYPRFKWRGVLIDSARHFLSVESIKRQLDGMAAAKLNVFHWHLTDDQGWRIETKLYPKLHELASGGEYYTQEEIRDIVAYAGQRGIRVIPEIDMPGHASVYGVAYPEYLSANGPYKVQTDWGVFEPVLDPSNEDVYVFIDRLLGEITSLFPDQYVHIGGDEVNPLQWQSSEKIREFMNKNDIKSMSQLQVYFNGRVEKILQKHGRMMIGWDEVFHIDLPKNIVVQSWRGQDSLAEISRAGYQGILSTGYYLDQPHASSYHYRNDPLPIAIPIHDTLQVGETWESYAFNWPRNKGSDVNGHFTVITGAAGNQRGFVDFKGKSRRPVNDIKIQHGVTSFWLDSWMGKTEFRVSLGKNNNTSMLQKALAVAANGHYPMTINHVGGSSIMGTEILENASPIPIENTAMILGGEMALWSELVDENVIDIRLWPRGFVIAERLWSAQDLVDENSLYKRLNIVSNWAITSVGLQHKLLSVRGMQNLVGTDDILPLQILSEAVEGAGYYHRHHEKHIVGSYNKAERLNKFVDTLPAESLEVRALDQLIEKWLEAVDKKAKTSLALKLEIINILTRWQNNTQLLTALTRKHEGLREIGMVAQNVDAVAKLGIELISKIESNEPLDAQFVSDAKTTLHTAQQFQQELIVAAAYPVEKLLNAAY